MANSKGFVLALVCIFIHTPQLKGSMDYWNHKMGNLTMPSLLEAMSTSPSPLGLGVNKAASLSYYGYSYKTGTPTDRMKSPILSTMFLRPDMLKVGTVKELAYLKELGPPFLPVMMPSNLSSCGRNCNYAANEVITKYAVAPEDADLVRATVDKCQTSTERHLCVSSLEAILDYVSSQFGTSSSDLLVEGINLTKEMERKRRYRISSVKKIGEPDHLITCHKAPMPYGLFFCHRPRVVVAYKLSLESLDSDSLKLDNILVSCHHDTENWNPHYVAFKILALKPGDEVCHFQTADSVVFINTTT